MANNLHRPRRLYVYTLRNIALAKETLIYPIDVNLFVELERFRYLYFCKINFPLEETFTESRTYFKQTFPILITTCHRNPRWNFLYADIYNEIAVSLFIVLLF